MQKAIQWNHALAVEKSIYNNKRTPQALIVSNSDPTSTGKQKRANDIEMELEKQNAISDKWVDDSILGLPQAKQKKKASGTLKTVPFTNMWIMLKRLSRSLQRMFHRRI